MRGTKSRYFLWKQDLKAYVPQRVFAGQGLASSHVCGRAICGTGNTLLIESPSDAATVAEMRELTSEEVDAAVTAASACTAPSHPWRSSTFRQRGAVLSAFADELERRAEITALAESLCSGMVLCDARASIASSIGVFRTFGQLLQQEKGGGEEDSPRRSASSSSLLGASEIPSWDEMHHSRAEYEPVGVAALITPFNYPLEMFAWKFVPAFAAGNGVVWKPPEAAPFSSFVVQEIVRTLERDGVLPIGVVNVVQGGPRVGHQLALHRAVDLISFTGSTAAGRHVQISAAQSNLKRVQLELGGNAPLIVAPSVCDYSAPTKLALQCFSNAGQSCTSSRRVLVPSLRAVEFVKGLVAATSSLRQGHALDPGVNVGPVISAANLDRLTVAIAESTCRPGASLVAGGFRPPFPAGHFLSPTILWCDDPKASIVQQELFGPVLCVIPYDGQIEDAVAVANDSVFGLSGTLVSNSEAEVEYATRNLRCGTVWVNCVDAMSPLTPFGGFRESGYGKDLGLSSLRGYMQEKVITRKRFAAPPASSATS